MSKIDELLKNEKVEWRKLGTLLDYEQPSKYIVESTEYDDRYATPVLTAGQTFILGFTNEVENIYKADKNNPVIIFDDFTSGNHWVDFDFKVKSSAMKMLKPKEGVNLRYCYHYIQTISIDTTEHKRLWISRFSQIEIPIPSDIKTQEKIAKILDKFTDCVTELQAELQARTKQYEYYRNLLLSEEYLNKLSENPEILGGGYRVKLTTLGDIGFFTRGNGLQKKDFLLKGNPVIHYGQIYTQYGFETDKTIAFVSDDVFSKLKKAKYKDILIATTSENIEDVGKAVVWIGYEEIGFSGDMYSYRTTENSKYIAYYFQTTEFQKQKERKVTGTKLIRIHGDDMAKFSISLPPIEIQNKVVEILDKFQSLLFETKGLLPQEIEQRQKQYEYYRERLLTFDIEGETISRQTDRQIISNSYFVLLKEAADIVDAKLFEVEWKALGNIGVFENGTGMPKSLFKENGSVGAIHYGHIYTKYNLFVDNPIVKVSKNDTEKLRKVRYGDLVIAKTSENIDDVMKTVAYLGNKIAVTGGHAAIFRHNENPKYLSYVFNGANYLLRQKNKLARGVKVIELSTTDMERIKMPLPSIPVQNYVVSILDNFDALINDISQGLPKEIELRQKQYEYYRAKILDFKRKN